MSANSRTHRTTLTVYSNTKKNATMHTTLKRACGNGWDVNREQRRHGGSGENSE